MIIGLTGRKGSGKDTAAGHLVAEHGFVRVAFADPLKDSVAALFGVTREQIEEWKNDPHVHVQIMDGNRSSAHGPIQTSMTFRQLLQKYGTEAHRDVFGTDFWHERGKEQIIKAAHEPDGLVLMGRDVVVSDVRFEDEAEMIRQLGGYVIEVCRPGIDTSDNHISEQPPTADAWLMNVGTIDELGTWAYGLINQLKENA